MIELLEHNVETYQNLCNEMEKHNKVALIQATGTGKSYIISKYIEEHCHNALILVPANAIGDQWQKLLPDVEVKTYQAMAKGIDGEYDLIVADEMHHLGSDVWGQKFVEYFMQNPEQKVIGATATEIRYLDNARDMVEEIFDGIAVRGVDLATAIDKGILPTFKYVVANFGTEKDFIEYKEKICHIDDTKIKENLGKRLELCMQNQISIKNALYDNLCPGSHRIVVFLNGLFDIEKATEMFKEIFPKCQCLYVSSTKTSKDNNIAIKEFQTSKKDISILLSVDMLNEGVHIDGVDSVVMFRNTESPQIYFQQIGRALAAKKAIVPTVFDFAYNADNIKSKMKSETNNLSDFWWNMNKNISRKRKIILKTYTKELDEILESINKNLCKHNLISDEQIEFILKNRMNMTIPEMAGIIGVHKGTIRGWLIRNGYKYKKCLNDTELEKYVRDAASKGKTIGEVSEAVGKSRKAIYNYTKRKGIDIVNEKENTATKYNIDEDTFIKKNKETMTIQEMADRLGRSKASVSKRVTTLGISSRTRVTYTKDQIEFICKNANKSAKELSQLTGISQKAIWGIISRNNARRKTNRRIIQIDKTTGKIIGTFNNQKHAVDETGISASGISMCLSGKKEAVRGFIFKYEQQGENNG